MFAETRALAAALLLLGCSLPFDPQHLPGFDAGPSDAGPRDDGGDAGPDDGGDGGEMCPEPPRVASCAGETDGALCTRDSTPGRCHEGECCVTCVGAGGCRDEVSVVACGAGGEACQACGFEGCVDGACRPSIAATWLSLSVDHSCMVGDDARVRCWGRGTRPSDAVGDHRGGSAVNAADARVGPVMGDLRAARVYAGWYSISPTPEMAHSCAIDLTGDAWCWGKNDSGQLGVTPRGTGLVAPGRVEIPVKVVEMALGNRVSFAISDDREAVWAWGHGFSGRQPLALDLASPPLSGLVADRTAACVLDGLGTVWCWGTGPVGPEPGSEPQRLPELDSVVSADVGRDHGCAVTEAGQIWCWGESGLPGLGPRRMERPATPAPLEMPGVWLEVSLGDAHSCAVREEATCPTSTTVHCWGPGDRGQLTGEIVPDRTEPIEVPLGEAPQRWSHLDCGGHRCCVLDEMGRPHCWGGDDHGELFSAGATRRPFVVGLDP